MRRPAGAWPEVEARLLGGRGDLEVLLEVHSQDREEGHRDRENRGDMAGPDIVSTQDSQTINRKMYIERLRRVLGARSAIRLRGRRASIGLGWRLTVGRLGGRSVRMRGGRMRRGRERRRFIRRKRRRRTRAQLRIGLIISHGGREW